MLQITIPAFEGFDNRTGEFIYEKEQVLCLEHSLVSLSKWESKWHKPFLSSEQKSTEEVLDYVRCMTITQNVDPKVYTRLTEANVKEINAYIEDPMTATWFNKGNNQPSKKNSEQITSELVYYWMVALQIPFECQKWHLNRLLVLIRICNIKNQPAKKMNRREVASRNTALNAARRKQLGSSG